MIKIGVVGFGFMGKTHFDIYQAMNGKAKATAIAESDPKKRSGDLSGIVGNITRGGGGADLADVAMFENIDAMLREADIDAVDITLPTFLHREAALKAFAAGYHVICEKPLALDHDDAVEMTRVAREAGKHLFVGQCIRFWPAYAKTRELVRSGDFGAVRTAAFSRLSSMPGWVWQNWARDADKSGGAPLDLHIHDVDFISHVFGPPRGVSAFVGGRGDASNAADHIAGVFHYDDDRLVTAVGAWEYSTGYPFSMTFSIQMERGCLALAAGGELTLYRDGRDPECIAVSEGDGWTHELAHFVDCLADDADSTIIPPEEAAFSVKLVRAELESARTGRRVDI